MNPTRLLVLVAGLGAGLLSPAAAACLLADDCLTDYEQGDCGPGFYVVENITVSSCCRGCKKLYGLTEICSASRICAPGLFCDPEVRECALDKSSCFYSNHLVGNDKPIYPPKCNPDGTYQPVQCKGDGVVGRCFCANARGKRIFGIAWTKDAKNMTCACSRRRADLEAAGRIDVTLHCASDGNYEPLQCDSGLCWCSEPETGEAVSLVVAEALVSQLPCYDEEKFGSQYLRKCESKEYAIALLKNKLAVHGTPMVTVASSNCDYDGTFGVYQIENGIAYCSWKNSDRIGPYQTEAGASLSLVNCNCARDTMYFQQVGMVMSQTCKGNGNYLASQQLNGQLYCVDDDGFPTTDLKPLGEELDCGAW